MPSIIAASASATTTKLGGEVYTKDVHGTVFLEREQPRPDAFAISIHIVGPERAEIMLQAQPYGVFLVDELKFETGGG